MDAASEAEGRCLRFFLGISPLLPCTHLRAPASHFPSHAAHATLFALPHITVLRMADFQTSLHSLLVVLLLLPLSFVRSTQAEPAASYPAHREIMKITERGLEPAAIIMGQIDGSVFFLNSSSSDSIHLSIDFGKHRFHCANPNLKLEPNGLLHTIRPLRPREFAVACFPDKGTYTVLARSSSKRTKEVRGEIVVR